MFGRYSNSIFNPIYDYIYGICFGSIYHIIVAPPPNLTLNRTFHILLSLHPSLIFPFHLLPSPVPVFFSLHPSLIFPFHLSPSPVPVFYSLHPSLFICYLPRFPRLPFSALSQGRTCRPPPPLKKDHLKKVVMNGEECFK